ncbi:MULTISPECIES: hypothetical protein [unclassified Microbacterium]|jgi:hypothetical protein|uniref:hypothetical protein n=1 Tax=unclassified Microbacterium TaxID=2609290 RepID=UPI000CFDF15C|nr:MULTISPECIES: hypothetical protein [unclassified Microbacterium]PQZ60273.1 hypothetical protein CQ032_05590 [Microbacterium sp. MYb43]PQZ76924.1 hypothetical protein CQ031_12340 [Microbacterium sp. MYb40]PRB23317.1 hypothetical protein CQ040_04190 [Microbacterium sp. MYb54]PRB28220.1 hypothetical protein CQ037_10530 [Microbacterium sp. MYb50]PRB66271.1 hypothetical protein CQ021_12235 [Microbacterium sp. MYb24]
MNSDQWGRARADRAAADRRARAAEEASSVEAAPQKTPVLGRTGFVAVLAMVALALLLRRSGLGAIGDVLLLGSYVVGVGFAAWSLVKKESPKFAIGTLALLVAGPVLLWALGALVWFGYGSGL